MAKKLTKWALPILTGAGSVAGWRIHATSGGGEIDPLKDTYLTGSRHTNSDGQEHSDEISMSLPTTPEPSLSQTEEERKTEIIEPIQVSRQDSQIELRNKVEEDKN